MELELSGPPPLELVPDEPVLLRLEECDEDIRPPKPRFGTRTGHPSVSSPPNFQGAQRSLCLNYGGGC